MIKYCQLTEKTWKSVQVVDRSDWLLLGSNLTWQVYYPEALFTVAKIIFMYYICVCFAIGDSLCQRPKWFHLKLSFIIQEKDKHIQSRNTNQKEM